MAETDRRPALAKDFPAVYAWIYPVVAEVGREHGYAVAIHGSLARDLDLIAVPWTDEACLPADLIAAVIRRVHAMDEDEAATAAAGPGWGPTLRPHGRLSWAIPLGIGAYLDISVIQPTRKGEEGENG